LDATRTDESGEATEHVHLLSIRSLESAGYTSRDYSADFGSCGAVLVRWEKNLPLL